MDPTLSSIQETDDASTSIEQVNWDNLNRLAEHVQQGEEPCSVVESAEFLIQRLNQENTRLQCDQKRVSVVSLDKRPPSAQQLREIIDLSTMATTRDSLDEPPLLTELEFWAALVADYNTTASKLPFLTSKKIRAGIPPPLRGLVWQAMSGARDSHLETLYETLSGECSPYDNVIGRDLSRTFPNVEMFKEEGGEGQQFLGKVLRAFSNLDSEVGYCQGLGFLVGPLLMNMSPTEAFAVLVRIMEYYDMRSMFTSNMSGLKLRLHQFSALLARHVPQVAQHLSDLDIGSPMYASQWFLSLFAVTCPLGTLHRLYDVLLAEGAPETIMRVAIALVMKNQDKILATIEFEDVLQLLLGRELWSVYADNDDCLINDAVGLTNRVTTEALAELEQQYNTYGSDELNGPVSQSKTLQAVTRSFLGKLFSSPPPTNSNGFQLESTPMKRSSSKMSTDSSSSISSVGLSGSSVEGTEATNMTALSTPRSSNGSATKRTFMGYGLEHENKQLHGQIEDLVVALGESQRETAATRESAEQARLELDEFKSMIGELLSAMRHGQNDKEEGLEDLQVPSKQAMVSHWTEELSVRIAQNAPADPSETPALKIKALTSALEDRELEVARMRDSLREVKTLLDVTQKEKSKFERALAEIRSRGSSSVPSENGVRELRLVRQNSMSKSREEGPQKAFRRSSTISPFGSRAPSPALGLTPEEDVDALRMELVQAKALTVMALEEAEDAKLALRRINGLLRPQDGVVAQTKAPVVLPVATIAPPATSSWKFRWGSSS